MNDRNLLNFFGLCNVQKSVKTCGVVFFCALLVFLGMQTPAFSASKVSHGGDFRFRIVGLSQVPTEVSRDTGSKITDSRFLRARTRLWLKYDIDADSSFKVRLTNEFRYYDKDRVNSTNPWEFPDEFIFDELYYDGRNLCKDRLSFRVGRQFFNYGTGKIFLEPSPLDGSRTAFSNALKASWKFTDTHTADVFYFDNPDRDGIALHSSDANLVEWAEDGVALYAENHTNERLPFEYYYVYKNEFRDSTDGGNVHLHTIGTRFMPTFNQGIKGNLEFAWQDGTQAGQGVGGMMVDSFVHVPFHTKSPHKPRAMAGFYHLSGDKAGTAENEAWHPVMGRWCQYSDFLLYAFINGGGGRHVGYWTNVDMFWAGLEYTSHEDNCVTLRYCKYRADEIDGATYPDSGQSMGDLLAFRFKYSISKTTFGQFNYEWFRPGDYYVDEMPCGSFFRVEVNFTF